MILKEQKGEQMQNKTLIPEIKTISEASKIVGLTKYHVRKLVLQDKIKYVRSGVKYLVNVDSLINYLNNGDNATVPDSNSTKNIILKGDKYDKTRH